MLRIVTDGATDMPPEWEKEFDIHMIPLRIRFGEETFVQGMDITNQNFYDVVRAKRQIPQTSLPSPYQIAEFYRSVAKPGDTILSLHISGKLSGTFSAVKSAVQEIGREMKILPIDTQAGSAAVGFMCREIRLMDRAGNSIQDILERIEEIKRQLLIVFTLDNLEFARMNGRISALQSILSSMLKINPIIVLKEGMLVIADKVRTRQKALEKVIEIVKTKVEGKKLALVVVHAADPVGANDLLTRVKQILSPHEIFITELAIPVAANLGPGALGIIAIPIK